MRTSLRILTAVTATSLVLAGCSSQSETTSTTATSAAAEQSAAFPVTIEHAFGKTTIEKKPERVATVAWSNHEVPLALGVVPVGMDKATWGDDNDNGMLPWVEDKLKELGGEQPVLFDATDGLPYEQIADTKPDVILAAYSGLTQEEYDTLSKIAPVVAYPSVAWFTTPEEMVEMNAKALGLAEEGEALNEANKKLVKDTFAKYPDLKDKSVLFTSFGGGSSESMMGFYTLNDPRAGFLRDAGFKVPKVVEEDTNKSDQFWMERSMEEPEAFEDVDIIITYGSDDPAENKAELEKLQADPLAGKIPAIAAGHVVYLGNGPLGATANPSPLGTPWGIDDYFAAINEAAK